MEAHRHLVILACVGGYMLLCVAIGLWALRRTRSSSDFFVAGRNLGVFVTAIAVFSSLMSGFAFVGGPGLVYKTGMSSMWMALPTFLAASLTITLVAKRIRLIAETRDTFSLPDVLAARYGSELTRLLAAAAILVGVLGYLATQILAMATVLKSLVDQTGSHTISLGVSAAIACAVLVFYCTAGGIIASVYTDLVQGVVMVIASVLVFLTVQSSFEGGFAGMSAAIAADDPEAIGPWGTVGIMGCLSWYLLFCLGACGQPQVIGKYMMFKRVSDLKLILPVAAIASTLTVGLWFAIGIFMRASVLSGTHAPLASPDDASPEFLHAFAHPALAGLVFASLFAAIMSTADAFLSIGSAAIVHDIPRAILGRSLRRELLWARVSTVVLTVLAAWFALSSGKLIALLGTASWGIFASALVPALTIGLNWKGATARAANASMLTALLANLVFLKLEIRLPHAVDPTALTLILSAVVFLVVSLLGRPSKLAADVDAILDL